MKKTDHIHTPGVRDTEDIWCHRMGKNLIVVLGGSGFMGRLLVHRLQAAWMFPDGTDDVVAILCNRGQPYWCGVGDDSDVHGTRLPLAANEAAHRRRVLWRHHFLDWDSEEVAVHLEALRDVIERLLFDDAAAVDGCPHHKDNCHKRHPSVLSFVDFSCTEPQYMQRLLRHTILPVVSAQHAASLVVRYLLVSTDSVYAVPPHGEHSSTHAFGGTIAPRLVCEDHATVVPPTFALNDLPTDDEGDARAALCAPTAKSSMCPSTETSASSSMTSSMSSSTEEELSYGEEKRAVEMLLCRYLPSTVHRCFLRLPDVVGPFDRTGRFWATVMWLEVALATAALQQHDGPVILVVPLPRQLADVRISTVAGSDVAGLIAWLLMQPPSDACSSGPAAWDTTLNVACHGQAPTLREWITCVAHCVHQRRSLVATTSEGAPALVVRVVLVEPCNGSDDVFTPDFYPSVDCGPVATHRLEHLLETAEASTVEWSSWASAVSASVAFFLSLTHPDVAVLERQIALRKLPRAIQKEWLRLHKIS